jgi:hypothetical protein
MNQDERREEDPRRFERASREVREEQSPGTGEEGSEEDRQQWEKTRDVGKEADSIPEEGQRRRGTREDPLEAPPGD